MKSKQELAVMNNMEWCGIVSRLHGCEIRTEKDLWGLDKRAPIYYPDVITRSKEISLKELASFMQDTQAIYIKDSYGSLQLEKDSFTVLMEANWIYHENREIECSSNSTYRKIQSKEDLFSWNAVSGLEEVLLPNILTNKDVSIYANEGETITTGFIVNDNDDTIGVSNIFSSIENESSIWSDIVRVIHHDYKAKHIVGYESDETLTKALEAGWENIGNLKIWMKEMNT